MPLEKVFLKWEDGKGQRGFGNDLIKLALESFDGWDVSTLLVCVPGLREFMCGGDPLTVDVYFGSNIVLIVPSSNPRNDSMQPFPDLLILCPRALPSEPPAVKS